MAKSKSEKAKQRQSKSVRTNYYLHQLVPIFTYCATLTAVLIGSSIIQDNYPLASDSQLSQNKTTLNTMENTVVSLNTQKKSLLEQKQTLETSISEIRAKRESEGSLRFYTANLPAYGRYVEFRANANQIEIVRVDINQEDNTVDYVVLGDYPDLINFFNALETREIYYIENFELLPSFSNNGSYVNFTANFNLDESITQRYEKKIKYEKPKNDGSIMEDTQQNGQDSTQQDSEVNNINVNLDGNVNNSGNSADTGDSVNQSQSAPDDLVNTGRKEPTADTTQSNNSGNGTSTPQDTNQTTPQDNTSNSTPNDTVVVEPLN